MKQKSGSSILVPSWCCCRGKSNRSLFPWSPGIHSGEETHHLPRGTAASPPPSSPPPSSVQIWDFSSLMDVPCPCRDRLNKPLLFQLCFSVYFSLSTKKDNNVIIFFFFHFFTSSQLSMLFAQWLNDLAQQHFSHAKEVNDLLSKRIIWKYKLQLSLILFFLNPESDDTQPKFRGEEPSPCVDHNLATLLSLCVRCAHREEDLAEIHFSCAAVNSQSRRQMRSEQSDSSRLLTLLKHSSNTATESEQMGFLKSREWFYLSFK